MNAHCIEILGVGVGGTVLPWPPREATHSNKSSTVDLQTASGLLSLCHVAQRNKPDKSFLFSYWNMSRGSGKECFPTLLKSGLMLAQP